MKIATVRYEGNVRNKTHRAPSGEMYRFGYEPPEVSSVSDAEFFEEKPNYVVEWSAVGTLTRKYSDDYESMKEAIKDLGYRKKQDLAKSLGIQANQSEDDLEEALEGYAEQLQHQMEHQ